MPRDWDAAFERWATPPSQTERDKADNAVNAVRNAIDASAALAQRSVSVFPQGSYRNRTNVRADSDVDVCVHCTDTMYYELPEGATPAQFGIKPPATYTYVQFRVDVQNALLAHFGNSSVQAGTKAFDVHANTYRIDADVLPCFTYKRYWGVDSEPTVGTAFLSGGALIHNYPQQHYDSGVAKNKETGRRFKGMARVLKSLRCEMVDSKNASATGMTSFLLESLVWNVPTPTFNTDESNRLLLRSIIIYLYDNTATDKLCEEWTEVNGIKYLFRSTQPWAREAVRTFLSDAWLYAEMTQL